MDNWGFTDAISHYCLNPYRDFDYATYVDKHKVKGFVKDIVAVAEEYAYFITAEEIDAYDFDVLPDMFVIKATHGCGWNIVIKDSFYKKEVIVKMKGWLARGYRLDKERQYVQVTRGVMIEEYLGDMADYKFYMFNGELGFIQVDVNRTGNRKQNFYSKDWGFTPINKGRLGGTNAKKPENFKKIIKTIYLLTEKIGAPPFVREDTYCKGGELYFGEYTFTPAGGNTPLQPEEYEKKYGALLKPSR